MQVRLILESSCKFKFSNKIRRRLTAGGVITPVSPTPRGSQSFLEWGGEGFKMQSEEWRPVVGFEGYYEVSSLGRVKSLERSVRYNDSYLKIIK